MAYEPQANKTGRIDRKPGTIVLKDGTTIDTVHHIIPDEKGVVHAYIEARQAGADASIPLENVRAITRSDEARDALTTSDEPQVAANGGEESW
jgi:Pyruvate/2-oxoacid:ferredoxin oxidoreductase gamma subunit